MTGRSSALADLGTELTTAGNACIDWVATCAASCAGT
jgi:hypothetical protein